MPFSLNQDLGRLTKMAEEKPEHVFDRSVCEVRRVL